MQCGPNGMISDLKEKEDMLMMRNGVNSIWMELGDKKASAVSFWCFLSLCLTLALNQRVFSVLFPFLHVKKYFLK